MCDGWITAKDAVIIRLSASWSPVKDKETPVAQLTLSDGLCEKQPWAHAQGSTAPSFRLLEQGKEECGSEPDDKFGQTAEGLHKETLTVVLEQVVVITSLYIL